ncbi:MAG: Uma2 family endonuclease [Candidatus Eremiobacteraeota bacterium]|nr:Uma2 family endonuclease [Candidatus Eremiobacteraeota bacterium]
MGPLRAIKSPDAAWVSRARIESLTETELAGFCPLAPDVAIEVASRRRTRRTTNGSVARRRRDRRRLTRR